MGQYTDFKQLHLKKYSYQQKVMLKNSQRESIETEKTRKINPKSPDEISFANMDLKEDKSPLDQPPFRK